MKKLIRRVGAKALRVLGLKKKSGFYGLGIAPKLMDILDKKGFVTPTPIQQKSIPIAIETKDLVGIAQTGTGKTIAFAIPIIQRLAQISGKALVLLPTRELALQVAEVCREFAPAFNMGVACLIGGEGKESQLRDLHKKARILIGTPGRVYDHIEFGAAKVHDVRILVLDEADRMFDMGFEPQITRIIRCLPKERQTMLFSATIPDEVMRLASQHMKLPLRVEVARSGTAAENVIQELYVVSSASRPNLLMKLLKKYAGTVLIFVETRYEAFKVASFLSYAGHQVAELHSDRTMGQRKEAMEGFRTGKYRIMVATDIAARGIDVTGIELVVNYQLPSEDSGYVHRIGRTGRAGQPGRSITFALPDQGGDVRSIETLTGIPMTQVTHPEVPAEKLWGYDRPSSGRGWNQRTPSFGGRRRRR
ncbi:MAG: ATP-dependent helicase [Elusimicrobia bacterium CG08_land_8_20_14_0_20_51_18]|nr:MAG: ATP-dependent helicase [Elusimicrobia bacterium CG08_land_8_20_14_0_20_51_18]